MGFEDEVEQSFGRPCRQCDGGFKRTYELTSSIVPRGTSFHRWVELDFLPIAFDPAQTSSRCDFPGPPEFGAVNPQAAAAISPMSLCLGPYDIRPPSRTSAPVRLGQQFVI